MKGCDFSLLDVVTLKPPDMLGRRLTKACWKTAIGELASDPEMEITLEAARKMCFCSCVRGPAEDSDRVGTEYMKEPSSYFGLA